MTVKPIATFTKSPQAILDYSVDWTPWLSTDTIVAVLFTPSSTDITVTASSFTTTHALVWLAGGLDGVTYNVACQITTAAGRTDERTMRFNVKER